MLPPLDPLDLLFLCPFLNGSTGLGTPPAYDWLREWEGGSGWASCESDWIRRGWRRRRWKLAGSDETDGILGERDLIGRKDGKESVGEGGRKGRMVGGVKGGWSGGEEGRAQAELGQETTAEGTSGGR